MNNNPPNFDDASNGPIADRPDFLSHADGFDRLWAQGTNIAELWRQRSPCDDYEIVYSVCNTDIIPWT